MFEDEGVVGLFGHSLTGEDYKLVKYLKKNVSELCIFYLLRVDGVVGDYAGFVDMDADNLGDFFHVSCEDCLDFSFVGSTGDICEELLKYCVIKEGEDFEDIHYFCGGDGGFAHPPCEDKVVDELVEAVEKGSVSGAVFM